LEWKKVLRVLPAIIYLVAIWLLSSDLLSDFVQNFNSKTLDKQLHFWGYGLLTLSISFAVFPSFVKRRLVLSWFLVIVFVALWGALDEFHQSFVSGGSLI
jgi:VanZ family protein